MERNDDVTLTVSAAQLQLVVDAANGYEIDHTGDAELVAAVLAVAKALRKARGLDR